MAVTTITPVKMTLNTAYTLPTPVALTSATDGAVVPFNDTDTKILVMVKNAHASAAKTVTFKKGDGIQGVADFTDSIGFGATKMFTLESGAFKNVSGTNKGKVWLVGESTDIQVSAVILP